MLTARVIGSVWATRRLAELPNGAFLEVEAEVTPALFAAVAANEAERAAPGVTLVDVSVIGAAGQIYLGGPAAEVRRAQDEITAVLSAVTGRDQ